MTQYNFFKNVKVIVGDKIVYNNIQEPYNENILNFLEELSKRLSKIKNVAKYPDILAAAFFCRKANLINKKKDFLKFNEFRVGLGLTMHISPSNTPINFFYTLIFGLITGNTNIVKVPSNPFPQIDLICKTINELLKKKFKYLTKYIKIIRYDKNNKEFINKISLICDARVIWGGDETINEIRKNSLKPRAFDVSFADRYSLCIINTKKFLDLNQNQKQKIINNFYNDTFILDQNACSSPHLVLWEGGGSKKAKQLFWNLLDKTTKSKYQLFESSAVDKYTQICKSLMQNTNIKKYTFFGNTLSALELKKIDNKIVDYRGQWGYFFDYDLKKISDFKFLHSKKIQTITYFGFNPKLIKNIILKYNLSGIDRLVPIGQALDLSFIWDGYDINKILTRVIDIK